MWFALIVGALIFIGGILYAIISEYGDFFDVLMGLLIATMVTFLLLFISITVGIEFPADEIYNVEETPIVALKDNSGSTGHFFLGGGYVKSDLYYYYFTENDDKGKEFHKIDADETIIYDDEKNNPHIEIRHSRNSNPIIRFFFITYKTETLIHVPEGSINYSFSVDLE